MIDILYLAHGREEFTEASLAALDKNTDDHPLTFYSDGVTLDSCGVISGLLTRFDCDLREGSFGGPVAIMNDFLSQPGGDIFAKIDNDVIVPPGWLEAALSVMEAHPELEFLGLEPPASRTANPHTGKRPKPPEHESWIPSQICIEELRIGYAPAASIGGVGLMRRSAFANRPPMKPSGPRGVGGFTWWQEQNNVRAGWIVPPLKLLLLDRLPFDPWLSLSRRYIEEGLQRYWTRYDPTDAAALWEWWKP